MARESECREIQVKPTGWRHKAALAVFLVLTLFYLVMEHTVHLFGVVSYFLVLLGPLMHFLHHAGDEIYKEHNP